MARPPKYTDAEIVLVIQTLEAENVPVNPGRVKVRLGGGNVQRIKALISVHAKPPSAEVFRVGPPEDFAKDIHSLTAEAARQMHQAIEKHWQTKLAAAAASLQAENQQLRQDAVTLKAELTAVSYRAQQLETRLQEAITQPDAAGLQAALRNAESDLRATQKLIDAFERGQGRDREEIRALQKRMEELVRENASLQTAFSIEQKRNQTRK